MPGGCGVPGCWANGAEVSAANRPILRLLLSPRFARRLNAHAILHGRRPSRMALARATRGRDHGAVQPAHRAPLGAARSTGPDRRDPRACGSPYQPPATGASPPRRCLATETDWAGACCGGREKVVAGLYPRSRRTVPVTIVSTSRLPHKRRSVASSGRVTFLCVCIENRLAFL